MGSAIPLKLQQRSALAVLGISAIYAGTIINFRGPLKPGADTVGRDLHACPAFTTKLNAMRNGSLTSRGLFVYIAPVTHGSVYPKYVARSATDLGMN